MVAAFLDLFYNDYNLYMSKDTIQKPILPVHWWVPEGLELVFLTCFKVNKNLLFTTYIQYFKFIST